jgi:hypothetical protein
MPTLAHVPVPLLSALDREYVLVAPLHALDPALPLCERDKTAL